jgi:addiction module RelE/StbE family toxin
MALMQIEMFPIQIKFSPRFKKDLKRLAKKYRQIKSDISPFIEKLQNRDLLGDRIPGTQYVVYKARAKNSDLQKGQSSGYRIIYLVPQHDTMILLTIYAKSDQPDIRPYQIEQIIKETE